MSGFISGFSNNQNYLCPKKEKYAKIPALRRFGYHLSDSYHPVFQRRGHGTICGETRAAHPSFTSSNRT